MQSLAFPYNWYGCESPSCLPCINSQKISQPQLSDCFCWWGLSKKTAPAVSPRAQHAHCDASQPSVVLTDQGTCAHHFRHRNHFNSSTEQCMLLSQRLRMEKSGACSFVREMGIPGKQVWSQGYSPVLGQANWSAEIRSGGVFYFL